jgi:hypothetical protein
MTSKIPTNQDIDDLISSGIKATAVEIIIAANQKEWSKVHALSSHIVKLAQSRSQQDEKEQMLASFLELDVSSSDEDDEETTTNIPPAPIDPATIQVSCFDRGDGTPWCDGKGGMGGFKLIEKAEKEVFYQKCRFCPAIGSAEDDPNLTEHMKTCHPNQDY